MKKVKAAITSIGGYLPEFRLTNALLETMVDTNDEWITSRTGIKERRILKGEGLGSSYMGIEAAKEALEKAGVDPMEIDMVICSTATPDMPVAANACFIATELGAHKAFGFDLMAACSGFLYGLGTAASFIESGRCKKVLLIGTDKMSSIIDYTDRATCVIFGDGAGAVLLEATEEDLGVIDTIYGSDGTGRQFLKIDAGGSILPASHETVDERKHYVKQEGQQVFKFAVTNMAEVSAQIMERNGLTAADVNWLVPHQANKRIIDATAKRMQLPDEKVMMNIQRYGNTTNGTLPLLLCDYEKQLKLGDNLIFAAFGGGFTWGAVYLKWAYNPQ
jgi:3-oxoacyl-[acyl-carrier-protein] synthase III